MEPPKGAFAPWAPWPGMQKVLESGGDVPKSPIYFTLISQLLNFHYSDFSKRSSPWFVGFKVDGVGECEPELWGRQSRPLTSSEADFYNKASRLAEDGQLPRRAFEPIEVDASKSPFQELHVIKEGWLKWAPELCDGVRLVPLDLQSIDCYTGEISYNFYTVSSGKLRNIINEIPRNKESAMGEHVRLPCHRSIQKILKLCLEPDKEPPEVQSKAVIQKQIELERNSKERPIWEDINPITYEPTRQR